MEDFKDSRVKSVINLTYHHDIHVIDKYLDNIYAIEMNKSPLCQLLNKNALFKKIVALSNLIQRIYHNDIRNMLP